MEPFEIIGQPLELYLAPVGTAFPAIGAEPDGDDWVLVGTSGTENQDESGVTVTHSQTTTKARPGGTTGARKAFRTEEDQTIKVTLWDVSLEQYLLALNGNAVSTTAAGTGTAGFKKLGLSRGKTVKTYALLARGVSPYDEAMNAQYEVPRCFQSGSPSVVYRKGVPAGIELQFDTLEDPDAASDDERFGRLIAQHQAPI